MNKNEIYVPLRTPEDCKRFLAICEEYKQPIYEDAKYDFMNGVVDSNQPSVNFDGEEWIRDLPEYLRGLNKTEITLDELEAMLGGKPARVHTSETLNEFFGEDLCPHCAKPKQECIKKFIQDAGWWPYHDETLQSSRIPTQYVIRFMQEYADQQTSSLRKELEDANVVISEQAKQMIELQNIIDGLNPTK